MSFDIISTREKGKAGLQSRLEELDDPNKIGTSKCCPPLH
jgi:hypothetical protein